MKRRMLGLSASLLLICLLPGTAAAAATVDQSNEAKAGFSDALLVGQSFTVGRAGLLTAVDLRLAGVPANLEVYLETQVRATGMPTDVKLATVAGSAPSTEQWVHFQFATPVQVLVGSRLVIVLKIDFPGSVMHSGNTYSGGTEVVHYPEGWEAQPMDLNFRTYVDSGAPTKAPTVAPTVAPTLPAPASAASGPATSAPGTSTGPSASPVSSPEASAGPPADAQSGGSGGLPVPIVVALILAVGLAVGGIGFAVGRRPRASA